MRTACALRRREQSCDPSGRLAASGRPSRGISVRFEATLDSLPRVWVAWVPHGVFTPSGHSRAGGSRAHCCADGSSVRLPIPCRGPSQHCRTVPGARGLRASDDASFPGLSCPTTHAGTADSMCAGLPPNAAPRPRFGYLHRDHPPCLREPCGPRASTGFPCRGVLLPSVGLPLGSPCPPAVVRVDSPRPYRNVRTRPASGP